MILTFCILTFFWFVLSGIFTNFPLIPGLLSILLISILFNAIIKIIKVSKSNFNPLYFIYFIFYTFKEILKSNIQVAKIILTKTPESKIAIIKNYNTNDIQTFITSSSITITPGTITLEATKDYLIIHCLDFENANSLEEIQDIKDFELAQIVKKLEGN
jgi:multicomponent Na+:H+ antiporter subunit E